MTAILCPTCGDFLFDDDDPYIDPDCIHCLEESYRAEAEETS